MENFKFILFSIIVLGSLGFAGYWAFSTIESGSYHVNKEKQEQIVIENEELKKENSYLKKELSLLEDEKKELENNLSKKIETNRPLEEKPTKTEALKYQSTIDEIQKLVNGYVFLKEKSQGPSVGTIQKFLNIYNGTNNKIDNDFGPGTLSSVKEFQKDQKIDVDGEVGPGTMRKMIEWLKKQ